MNNLNKIEIDVMRVTVSTPSIEIAFTQLFVISKKEPRFKQFDLSVFAPEERKARLERYALEHRLAGLVMKSGEAFMQMSENNPFSEQLKADAELEIDGKLVQVIQLTAEEYETFSKEAVSHGMTTALESEEEAPKQAKESNDSPKTVALVPTQKLSSNKVPSNAYPFVLAVQRQFSKIISNVLMKMAEIQKQIDERNAEAEKAKTEKAQLIKDKYLAKERVKEANEKQDLKQEFIGLPKAAPAA